MARYKIDEVCQSGDNNPVVVDFMNAYPTAALNNVPCTVLQDSITKNNVYAFEVDGMLYTAKEATDNHMQTVIVKRNKLTGKVTLMGTTYAVAKPELMQEIKETNADLKSDKLELSRKFGSKKLKQVMEQREKLKVNIDTVTEQMQKVTEEVKEEQLDLASYSNVDSNDFYIPPMDRTAKSAQDVYDIDKILTEDEFEKIYTQLKDKDYTSDMLPWIKELLGKKKLSPKLTVLAVYANCLLNLYNTAAKEISKKTFVTCPHSITLHEIILKNFTSRNNGRILRPGPYKDKSLCYAIVLLLLVNDLKFDLDRLCQAIKLTVTNASMKIRTTGATVVKTGSNKYVQLKMPLNNKPGFRRRSTKF